MCFRGGSDDYQLMFCRRTKTVYYTLEDAVRVLRVEYHQTNMVPVIGRVSWAREDVRHAALMRNTLAVAVQRLRSSLVHTYVYSRH
jgi:hypothetical protein